MIVKAMTGRLWLLCASDFNIIGRLRADIYFYTKEIHVSKPIERRYHSNFYRTSYHWCRFCNLQNRKGD